MSSRRFAPCLSHIPLRREDSDRSELISQILYGEELELLEESGAWMQVKSLHDEYCGFVDKKQLRALPAGGALFQVTAPSRLMVPDLGTLHLSPGSLLRNFNGAHAEYFGLQAEFHGQCIPFGEGDFASLFPALVQTFKGSPYLWGGRTIWGVDCSGLVQVMAGLLGVALPRDSKDQATRGQLVDFLEGALPGDLAFFDNTDGQITHVGIILENGRILHAHGHVRVDALDSHGIFNPALNKHSHKLRLIRRIF